MNLFKSLFSRKRKNNKFTDIIKSEDSDQSKNTASFTDYNKKVIFVSIKLVNNVPYFFIENDKLEFVFDKDSAALLMLLLNNYITNSSFQNFEEILKGDK
jgi:hypothetical protein